MNAMPFREVNPNVLGFLCLSVSTALFPGRRARTNSDQVNGPMAGVVIAIAEEVLSGKFPVRWKDPLVNPNHLGATLAPIPTIKHLIKMRFRISNIGQEIRSFGIPGRPNAALVVAELCDLYQRPLLPIENT
jgi:hypothetical protein